VGELGLGVGAVAWARFSFFASKMRPTHLFGAAMITGWGLGPGAAALRGRRQVTPWFKRRLPLALNIAYNGLKASEGHIHAALWFCC